MKNNSKIKRFLTIAAIITPMTAFAAGGGGGGGGGGAGGGGGGAASGGGGGSAGGGGGTVSGGSGGGSSTAGGAGTRTGAAGSNNNAAGSNNSAAGSNNNAVGSNNNASGSNNTAVGSNNGRTAGGGNSSNAGTNSGGPVASGGGTTSGNAGANNNAPVRQPGQPPASPIGNNQPGQPPSNSTNNNRNASNPNNAANNPQNNPGVGDRTNNGLNNQGVVVYPQWFGGFAPWSWNYGSDPNGYWNFSGTTSGGGSSTFYDNRNANNSTTATDTLPAETNSNPSTPGNLGPAGEQARSEAQLEGTPMYAKALLQYKQAQADYDLASRKVIDKLKSNPQYQQLLSQKAQAADKVEAVTASAKIPAPESVTPAAQQKLNVGSEITKWEQEAIAADPAASAAKARLVQANEALTAMRRSTQTGAAPSQPTAAPTTPPAR